MADMVRLPDIAKRLRIDLSTVRRLIAKEGDSLKLTLHRGKHDRLFLSSEDAEKLIASYEARRGPVSLTERPAKPLRTTGMGTFTSSSWCRRRCRTGSRSGLPTT